MSDPKCAKVLLEAAERDLSALRGMTDEEVFADEIAGFLAQQATEKLVKAWIALLGETYPITHDIAQLLGVLTTRQSPGLDLSALVELTPYAVRFRYAGRVPDAPALDRAKTVARIEELLEQVRSRLDQEPTSAPSNPPVPFLQPPLTAPGESRSPIMRSEQTIFDDLAHLCASKGFIHALALLSCRDNVLHLDDGITAESLASMYSPRRLTRTEFSTLVGLLMRAPADYSLPTPEVLSDYLQQSESLLEELHSSMLPADPQEFLAQATDPDAPNPFVSGENLREPIFYTAESAYPFQYRDLAPRKYRRDAAWLRTNKRIDLDVAHAVCRCLPELLSEQITCLARSRKPAGQWTLLPAFLVSPTELASRTGRPLEDVRAFLEAFTQPAHQSNDSFTSLGAFNAAYAYPFIRHGPGYLRDASVPRRHGGFLRDAILLDAGRRRLRGNRGPSSRRVR